MRLTKKTGFWALLLLFLPLFIVLEACKDSKPAFTYLEGQAQGTTFRISYGDSLSRDFSSEVDSLFRVIDASMSLWDSTSIISRMNRNETEALADEHFSAVFQRAQEVAIATGGFFDITVGPLVQAWGFSYKKGLPPPDAAQVDSLRQLIGYQKVQLVDGRLQKANPAMQVDVNAIAQGYTVDVLADFLEQKGLHNYLVEVGGEVYTSGKNERGEIWRIGIDKPVEEENPEADRPLQTIVPISGKALATSGSYRKFVVRDGQKFSHAINPETGYPITHNLLSISVIADDCVTADAYATAFLVLGLEKAKEIAREKAMEIYGISANAQGELEVYSTLRQTNGD